MADVARLELAALLRRNRGELRRLVRRQRLTGKVPRVHLDAALILYHWFSPNTEPSVGFIRRRVRSGLTEAEIRERVESAYLEASTARIADLLLDTESQPSALKLAQDWAREYDLMKWVEEQNRSKGIAPLHIETLHHYNNSPGRPDAGIERKKERTRRWLHRWTRRWKLSAGKLAEREHVPLDVMREKARPD